MTPDTGPQRSATVTRFTALVLAGERPGGDALARAVGAPHKALIPVAGEAMLLRVVRALGAARHVGSIVVSGLPAPALASDAELGALLASGRIAQLDGRDTPSTSVLDATERLSGWAPLLVTTADHPLLRPEVIDYFCAAALASGGDVALGLVDGALVKGAFPESKRTFLRFRDGAYCGCNLFALLTPAASRAPAAWRAIEQERKRPWRMIRALGLGAVVRFLLGRLTLAEVMRLASDRIGAQARVVLVPYAEAAVDVDKPSDLAHANALLAR